MAGSNDQRPIIVRKIKKSGGGHHGGAWKVAYADFVTAMMAFFMLLWLISNPDKQRLKGIAEYFSPNPPSAAASAVVGTSPGESQGSGGEARRAAQASSSASATGGAKSAAVASGTARVPDASLRVLAQEMRIAISGSPDAAADKPNVKVEEDQDGLRVDLMDDEKRAMFKPGTAELNGYARAMITGVATKLLRTGARISIEGHTDGAGGQAEANWRLSGERALAARTAMIAAGLGPDRFAGIVAKGPSEPVYPGQPDRPENRRITIVVEGGASSLPTDSSFKF